MSQIAFMTFGVLVAPWGDASVSGFEARLERTFAAAEGSQGFVARSIGGEPTSGDPSGLGEWGPSRRSSLYPGSHDPDRELEASTLSLWRDLESVHAFAYSGAHLDALRHRAEWFEPRRWPAYVAWWVPDDAIPSWDEAYTRLERLHADGPTPVAFDFHHPFDPEGQPTRVERAARTPSPG